MNHVGSKSIFYIDSQNRLNEADTSSNFTVRVDMPPMNKYNRICVLQASIPKSYYLISDGRNTLALNEPGTVSLSSGSITSNRKTSVTIGPSTQWTACPFRLTLVDFRAINAHDDGEINLADRLPCRPPPAEDIHIGQ